MNTNEDKIHLRIKSGTIMRDFIVPKSNQGQQIEKSYSYTQSYILECQFDHTSQIKKIFAYEWPNNSEKNNFWNSHNDSKLDCPPHLGAFVGIVTIVERRTAKPNETTYNLGEGVGQGEEHSTIPGYEGIKGYWELLNDLHTHHLPESFIHPQTGQLFVSVKRYGGEYDEAYEYIIVDNPTEEEIQEAVDEIKKWGY